MSSYGERVGVVRSDDDLASSSEIIDGHVVHLSRRQVKAVLFNHGPACTRCFQYDLSREDVARDREAAICLADLDSDMREMEVVPTLSQYVTSWPTKLACRIAAGLDRPEFHCVEAVRDETAQGPTSRLRWARLAGRQWRRGSRMNAGRSTTRIDVAACPVTGKNFRNSAGCLHGHVTRG